jgi:hypothetical protein
MRIAPLGPGFACILISHALAQTETPIHGHYPPGQTGLRGAATPDAGWSLTDFNRLFSNIDIKDQSGATVEQTDELRIANIGMIGWTSGEGPFGIKYGAIVGVPVATGNLNPDDPRDSALGLGDIIVTPISLYGSSSFFDYQGQFSVWTPTGEFRPGGLSNRGSGFWSLIYSAGGVWYPGGDRRAWSLSAVARIEQNFEQAHTGITPGDDLDLDWGIGRIVRLGPYTFDAGASGFATWQITRQSSGLNTTPYRYYGIGPELSANIADGWSVRIRAQWEFGARNVVEGNNLWLILNTRL